MTGPRSDNSDLSQAERIDQVCTAFEAAWKAKETPRLEDWVGSMPETDYRSLLKELLLVEVHYRRRRGETVDAGEYRRRFPEMELSGLSEIIGADWQKPGDQTTMAQLKGAATVEPASGMVRYSGDYELMEEIGRGGMGVVYRAHHAGLGRTLAVKVLLDRHADSAELKRRFLEEAKIMGQLQHPGVAPIHELGRLENGRPFFSMKQVQGQTLAELFEGADTGLPQCSGKESDSLVRDNFPVTNYNSRFLAIFEQVCQTVAYAHAQGILHRDLKPANIMVGEFGEVQVMDWGLAKRIADLRLQIADLQNLNRQPPSDLQYPNEEPPSENLQSAISNLQSSDTAPGRVLGTAAYMAPEQARGEVEQLDERCDVFGLGAILCEILTGQPAFPGDSQVDSHRRAARGDLSDAFARLNNCGAGAELVALARSCLAPDKEQRPRHAGVVAAAMADYQAGVRERLRQAEIQAAAAQVKAAEERKRRKVSLALAGVLVATILAAAAAGVWYFQDQAERAETEADLQTKLAQEQFHKDKVEAEHKAEKSIQAAKLAERKKQLEKSLAKEFAGIEKQRAALLGKLGNPLKAAELLSDIDQWKGLVVQTRESWKRAKFLVKDGQESLDDSWSEQLNQFNQQIEGDEQNWQWAKELDEINAEAITLVEGKWQAEKGNQRYADVFQEMKLEVAKGDPVQLATQIKGSPLRYALVAALDRWALISWKEPSVVTRLLEVSSRADPDDWRDQVRDPKNWGDVSKLKHLAATAQVDKQTPRALDLLVHNLFTQNHKAEAAQLLRQALLYHPKDFWLHFDLGWIVSDPVEKVGCYTAALAIRPGSAVIHNNLGMALADRKDLDAAIKHYEKAIELAFNYAPPHNNKGLALYNQKNLKSAIPCYLKAIELKPNYFEAHCNLGDALRDKKDLDGAIRHYQQALAINPKLGLTHHILAGTLYEKGDLTGAIRHYHEAITLDPKFAPAHSNLGVALSDKGDLAGAIWHYEEAIALDPKFADPHNNLGNALKAKGDLEGAIKHYLKAIDIKPNYARAHCNLGVALRSKQDLAGALKHYNLALAINPNYVPAHSGLGTVLREMKDLAGALKHYNKALELAPNDAGAHCNLGLALREQGKFAAALALLKKGHELGSKKPFWNQPSAKWIKQTERLLELEQKLPAILKNTEKLWDVVELIELAELCYYTQHHVSAARFYGVVLEKAPHPATTHHYKGACAAVLAATGRSKDANKLDKDAPAKLRKQALGWLTGSLAMGKSKSVDSIKLGLLRYHLHLWQCDPDLVSVRDEKELAKLPEAERKAWQALWAEIADIVNLRVKTREYQPLGR